MCLWIGTILAVHEFEKKDMGSLVFYLVINCRLSTQTFGCLPLLDYRAMLSSPGIMNKGLKEKMNKEYLAFEHSE